MTSVLAPVLPHLAEEIHAAWASDEDRSVFMTPWAPLARLMPHNLVTVWVMLIIFIEFRVAGCPGRD